ncbi:MAG: tetratricopeptide repeat protein [Deltaproteobacteria bacterium]|nr:tetratricopeptide repeat protein [Deltaproteobacteria bacterium]
MAERGGRTLALLVALLAAGCAGPAYGEGWVRSFSAARRAIAAGRHEEALSLLEQAAKDARRARDRDEARFLYARILRRLDREPEALAVYERMLREAPTGSRAARVRFEQANTAIELGDPRSDELLVDAIARHGEDGAAVTAIRTLVRRLRETGTEEELRTRLASLHAKVKAPEGVQQLEYERGLSFAREGKLAEAHAELLATARKFPLPHGPLTDDAYYQASVVSERMNEPRRAVEELRELLGAREVAWFGQSYERPKYPFAQMRIAELYRDALGDLRGARDEFRRVATTHESSILGDDATWQEGVVSLRLAEPEEACRAAKRLKERYASSRYLGCVRALCATAEPPGGARECPDYAAVQLAPSAVLPRTAPLSLDAP